MTEKEKVQFKMDNPLVECAEKAVLDILGMDIACLRSKVRTHRLTTARMMFTRLCFMSVKVPYLISRYLDKYYTVIYYWMRTHDSLYETDEEYAKTFDKVREKFTKYSKLQNDNEKVE